MQLANLVRLVNSFYDAYFVDSSLVTVNNDEI